MAIGVEHEHRKRREHRKARLGRIITCVYEVGQDAIDDMLPSKGDTMPGDAGTAPFKPYYYRLKSKRELKRAEGNRVELIVEWYLPILYS
tara:strand:- start:191 stop:460 length:270 start_codon:yes stop_codon:yes gene_type:complete